MELGKVGTQCLFKSGFFDLAVFSLQEYIMYGVTFLACSGSQSYLNL